MQNVPLLRRVESYGTDTGAGRSTDLAQVRSVNPDNLQNDGIAADLTIHGSSFETGVVAEKAHRVDEAQGTRDRRVAGSDILSLGEEPRNWKNAIAQARAAGTVKAASDRSREGRHGNRAPLQSRLNGSARGTVGCRPGG